MKDHQLLPCPFCGGEATESEGQFADGKSWTYIECLTCGRSGEPNIWNTRALPSKGMVEKEHKEFSGYAIVTPDMKFIDDSLPSNVPLEQKKVEIAIMQVANGEILNNYALIQRIAENICKQFGTLPARVPSVSDIESCLTHAKQVKVSATGEYVMAEIEDQQRNIIAQAIHSLLTREKQ